MNELTKSIEKSARKVQNQISVLNTIRIYEQISQVEIASATGLQPSTVSNLCRELKSLGQIRYSGKGKSGKLGGKKSDLLSLSQDYGVFSAVYIETDRVKSAIVDFAGNMIEEYEQTYSTLDKKTIVSIATKQLRRHREKQKSLKGIGIAVQSAVTDAGSIITSPGFDLHIPQFKQRIKQSVPLTPLIMENDANCVAYYSWLHFGQRYRNLIAFLIYLSPLRIGSGIIIDNKLYRGSNGAAGEIWRPHSPLLEHYKNLKSFDSSRIVRHRSFQNLVRELQRFVLEAALLLDTESVVLCGDITQLQDEVLTQFMDSLRKRAGNIKIELLKTPNLPLLGAALLAAYNHSYLELLGRQFHGKKSAWKAYSQLEEQLEES